MDERLAPIEIDFSSLRDRGQSEVVGVILLVAIVIIGITALVGGIGQAQFQQTSDVPSEVAENDMLRIADKISLTTTTPDGIGGETDIELGVQRINQGSPSHRVLPSEGRVVVSAETASGRTTIANQSMGAIEYRNRKSEATVGYQSGSVFSWNRTIENPPEILQSEALSVRQSEAVSTVSVQAVQFSNTTSLTRTATIGSAGNSGQVDPVVLSASEALNITVESQYVTGWVELFEQNFPPSGRSVSYSAQKNRVSLTYQPTDRQIIVYTPAYGVQLRGS